MNLCSVHLNNILRLLNCAHILLFVRSQCPPNVKIEEIEINAPTVTNSPSKIGKFDSKIVSVMWTQIALNVCLCHCAQNNPLHRSESLKVH